MAETGEDPVMKEVRKLFADSKKTYQEIGEGMGYGRDVARQSVFQFLKSENPRINMLRRFANALGIHISTLFK